MNCAEFETCLHPFVDGELDVAETLAAAAHVRECSECGGQVERERRFRELLRRQPRESAPSDLRATIRRRIRRSGRVAAARPWLLAPLMAAALLLALLLPGSPPSLVSELVDKHIAYAQIEQPAEFVSAERAAVEAWFSQRADLRVTVSDYSPSNIRLIGARIAEAEERKVAYVLYEKGRALLSVFMVPSSGRALEARGRHVAYRGNHYVTFERKGYRTVSWSDGHAVFGLVSMLDYEALLECADKLRADRARQAGG